MRFKYSGKRAWWNKCNEDNVEKGIFFCQGNTIVLLFIHVWFQFSFVVQTHGSIPVVARSKVWVFGLSVFGIADSSPAGVTNISLFWVLRVVSSG